MRHGVYYVKIGRKALIAWIDNPVNAFSAHVFGKRLHFHLGDNFLFFLKLVFVCFYHFFLQSSAKYS